MMLSIKSTVVGFLAALTGVTSASVHINAAIASGYYFRGFYTDGIFVQPAIDIGGFGIPEEYGFLQLGAWGNYALNDDDADIESFEFSEIDWYSYYSLPAVVDHLELYVGYIEYVFPNVDTDTDKEVTAGLQYDIHELELGAMVYFGVGGGIRSDIYYSFSAYFTREISERLYAVVGTQIGYYDPEASPAGWNDQTVDIGAIYWLSEPLYIEGSMSYAMLLDKDADDDADSVNVIGTLRLGAVY